MEQVNKTEYFVLQPYKDWLLINRGELRPEIGDILVKPEVRTCEVQRGDETNYRWDIVENGRYLSKFVIDHQPRLDLFNKLIIGAKKKNKDYLADYYIKIDYNPNELNDKLEEFKEITNKHFEELSSKLAIKFAEWMLSKNITRLFSMQNQIEYRPIEFNLLKGELLKNGKELYQEFLKEINGHNSL